MQLTEFNRLVDETLPPAAAMSGDAIGLQVDSRRGTASNVLVTLEVTDAVVIRADIALLVVHTAFDAFPQGTNHILAEHLGLFDTEVLVPSDVDRHGMGIVGTLASPRTMQELVATVATVCGSPVRYLPSPTDPIQRVALVGGSGISFYDDAVRSGADVFITADVKYHAFHAADGHIGLIDPGHYEMERFVPDGLIAALKPLVPADVTLLAGTVNTNPVRYASPLPHEHSSLQ